MRGLRWCPKPSPKPFRTKFLTFTNFDLVWLEPRLELAGLCWPVSKRHTGSARAELSRAEPTVTPLQTSEKIFGIDWNYGKSRCSFLTIQNLASLLGTTEYIWYGDFGATELTSRCTTNEASTPQSGHTFLSVHTPTRLRKNYMLFRPAAWLGKQLENRNKQGDKTFSLGHRW